MQRRYPRPWRRNLAQTDQAFCGPGGESYRAFRARCLAAIRQIAAAHPGQRVLVVTHAGVITQVVGALAGTSAARWGAFRTANANITELRWWGVGGTVMRFDARDHLDVFGHAGLPGALDGRPGGPGAWSPAVVAVTVATGHRRAG